MTLACISLYSQPDRHVDGPHETRKSNCCDVGRGIDSDHPQAVCWRRGILVPKVGTCLPFGRASWPRCAPPQTGQSRALIPGLGRGHRLRGLAQVYDGNSATLLAADGRPVENYPRFVEFRVTISARRRAVPGLQPLLVNCESQCIKDANEYLLSLQFRVKIFRALHVTVLEPKVVKLIGMPPDVPCDERIYRLSFDLGDVPLADRIVFEVLSPAGERLTKFHLDM